MSTTTTTVTTTSTTQPNQVPQERSATRYYLKLSGIRWERIITQNYTELQSRIRPEIASKFFTSIDYVVIWNMSLGSLLVDFSVYPSNDGAQIRENEFLTAYQSADTSWLSSTNTFYKGFSNGDPFTVISSRYQNANQTQPPVNVVCADGCVGAITAAGVVVFVLCAFIAWAWIKFSKERDTEVRRKLGIISPADDFFDNNNNNKNEPTGPGIRTAAKNNNKSGDQEMKNTSASVSRRPSPPPSIASSSFVNVRPNNATSKMPAAIPRLNASTTLSNQGTGRNVETSYAVTRPISVNRSGRGNTSPVRLPSPTSGNRNPVFRPPSVNRRSGSASRF